MPLLRKRVNVRTNGTPRSLLLIEENKKGDVYVRIKSGTQVGIPPNEIPVLQDRYSIHPSPKSPNYSTLKSTFELANGLKRTSVAVTDAVKQKSGFAHLFSHRSSDLMAPLCDVPNDDIETIELGDFDNRKYALFLGAFIGHPDSEFCASENEIINSIRSEHFQIVIANVWVDIPPLPFAWTMNSLTLAPEIFEDEGAQESAYHKMAADSAEGCLKLFRGLKDELLVNLLETYKAIASDEQTKKNIQDSIDAVPRIPSIRM